MNVVLCVDNHARDVQNTIVLAGLLVDANQSVDDVKQVLFTQLLHIICCLIILKIPKLIEISKINLLLPTDSPHQRSAHQLQ
jgi:hypothetical protein